VKVTRSWTFSQVINLCGDGSLTLGDGRDAQKDRGAQSGQTRSVSSAGLISGRFLFGLSARGVEQHHRQKTSIRKPRN